MQFMIEVIIDKLWWVQIPQVELIFILPLFQTMPSSPLFQSTRREIGSEVRGLNNLR